MNMGAYCVPPPKATAAYVMHGRTVARCWLSAQLCSCQIKNQRAALGVPLSFLLSFLTSERKASPAHTPTAPSNTITNSMLYV